jgi:hypothetical protein
MNKPDVPLRITVTPAFRDRIKAYAVRTGRKIGEIIEELAGEELKRLERELIEDSLSQTEKKSQS